MPVPPAHPDILMKELVIFKYFQLAALALLAGLFLTPAAAAESQQPGDVFEISNVHVDVTAAMATEARDQAIQQGQRQALSLLFRKIVMDDDLAKIPTLEESLVNDLVQGFEVNNEKTSSVRYIADLTLSFNRDGVLNLLQRLGISFSQTPARPMLFLGIQRYGGTITLWSDQNWWMQAWGRTDAANHLVSFVTPAGDMPDRLIINAEQAFRANAASLGAAVKKYDVEDALIATATITQDFGSGAYKVHVDARKWPLGPSLTSFDVTSGEGETLEALLDRTAQTLTKRVSDDWKQQTLIYFGKTTDLAVTVPLNSLEDWLTIKARLGTVGAIRKTAINRLTVNEAGLTLSYAGGPTKLALALAQTNIELVEGGGIWSLRLKRAGAP